MKLINKKLNKDEIKTKNIILVITSFFTLLIGVFFFIEDGIKFLEGNEVFYVAMLLYFGCEFTNYLLTKAVTGMHSLYVSLACLIASVSGLLYMNEQTNLVLSFTLIGWMIMMVVIKLIRIEDLRKELNYSVFINVFSMSLFILLGFLTITNLYKGISNPNMMLGFFFTVNSILNIIETIGNVKFCNK